MTEPLPTTIDVLVIGAGPAGSTAAALIHRAGFRVCVLEREQFPRFVIGESLLPRCMDLLDEAGLLDAVRARSYLVKRGALFLRGAERFCFDFSEQHTRGWEYTWQVPRADFDATLADAVAASGVPFFYRHSVTAVSFAGVHRHASEISRIDPATAEGAADAEVPGVDPAGPDAAAGAEVAAGAQVSVVDPDGRSHRIRARFVIDASGYGRVLPRLLGLEAPSRQPPRQALFTHLTGDRRPAGPEEGRIWVTIHPAGAWVWIIPFSTGVTSVGVVGAPEFFAALPEDPEAALREALAGEPNAAGRLEHTDFLFTPRTLKGYSVSVTRLYGAGYCLVGNATEFLDPVFSSGVTLALESANRAAKALIRQLNGETVEWERDYAAHMRQGIDVFRSFVNGWYDGSLPRIFFAPGQDPDLRRQICSVLAGYVWDQSNPFVRHHARKVSQLARLLEPAGDKPEFA